MTPNSCASQRVLSWNVSTEGSLTPWIDGFGNNAHVSTIDQPHNEIKLLVEGTVETFDTAGVLSSRDGLPAELFLRDTPFTAAGEAPR